MLERIRVWHASGLWSDGQVLAAVARGWISQSQADEVLA